MRDSRPQLLDILFEDALEAEKTPLNIICRHAIILIRLNRILKNILPASLHTWCRVANVRHDILVLEAANASWMMRLRYEQSMLLSTLRAQILPSLSSIDIRINPGLMVKRVDQVKNVHQLAPLRQLSKESAMAMRGLANRSPEKLREILERLATLALASTKTSKV